MIKTPYILELFGGPADGCTLGTYDLPDARVFAGRSSLVSQDRICWDRPAQSNSAIYELADRQWVCNTDHAPYLKLRYKFVGFDCASVAAVGKSRARSRLPLLLQNGIRWLDKKLTRRAPVLTLFLRAAG